MKSVIVGDRLDQLQRALDRRPGPVNFIHLTITRESFQVRDCLRKRADTQELPAGAMFRQRRESFRKKYIQLVGQLNRDNQCLEWWGTPLTDKIPHRPDLYRDIAYFLLVVELVGLRTETLVVISDSADLSAQVMEWASGQEEVEALDLVKTRWTWRRILKNYSPAGIIIAFFRLVCGRWFFSRRFHLPRNTQVGQLVINSLTHIHSFPQPGKYLDAYFAPLVDSWVESKQKGFILAGVQEQATTQLKKLRSVHGNLPILPVESCLTFGNILSALFRAMKWYFKFPRLKGLAKIDGTNVSCLVKRAVTEERHSGSLFMNLGVYYAARNLARTVPVDRWFYPFENLAWERMLLIGAYNASKEIRMVGYQHTSLTKAQTDILLPEQLDSMMPLPKSILTTGDVTREWLEAEGNYPSSITIKTACALRQTLFSTSEAKPRGLRLTRLLVALATSMDEYVRALVFLEQAFAGVSGYEINVRPHPTIPIGPALETSPVSHPNFSIGNERSLSGDLQWADVALYASSTVGLEALQLGIPAIYLDLGNVLDTDPIVDWERFKWRITDPPQLIETLREIEGLSEADYQTLQREGQEYAARYLRPVTESALQVFLDA